MEAFLDRIKSGEVLVSDGAMGTRLMQFGLTVGDCPEEYNLIHPEILISIAKAYDIAGADIVQTNTFGGSPLKLAGFGLDDKTEQINRLAVEHVKSAVSDKTYISGSIGPTGKILKPYGDTDQAQVYDSYLIQTRALIQAGVNLLCIETMTDINEAILAVKAARQNNPDIPVIATMTFDSTPNGFFTIMGVTIKQAAEKLAEAGANLIGSNCGNGIEKMILIAREFKRVSDLPLAIQSNAGLPEMRGTEVIYPESPQFMADKAQELVELGVQVIGGCCGTTPDHITAFRSMVDLLKKT
jgi:5-methyltetrahydrofolate--homocysteine methyltransferase